MFHCLLIHHPSEGYLGCSQIWWLWIKAVLNTHVQGLEEESFQLFSVNTKDQDWQISWLDVLVCKKSPNYLSNWVHDKPLKSCPTLCDPMDCSPPGFSVRGILQARRLEWVTMPSSRGPAQVRDRTCISYISYVSCIGRRVLYP